MNNETSNLVYLAMYAALAVVLDYVNQFIPFLQMPNGGSINLALIPIFIASYQLGWQKGVISALLWWLLGLGLGLNNFMLSPLQVMLDYILPAAVIGLASIFKDLGKVDRIYVGITISMLLKYLMHVLAGAIFWFPQGTASGSGAAWAFSISYNAWYNLATYVVAIILVPLIIKRLHKTSRIKFKALD